MLVLFLHLSKHVFNFKPILPGCWYILGPILSGLSVARQTFQGRERVFFFTFLKGGRPVEERGSS